MTKNKFMAYKVELYIKKTCYQTYKESLHTYFFCSNLAGGKECCRIRHQDCKKIDCRSCLINKRLGSPFFLKIRFFRDSWRNKTASQRACNEINCRHCLP